MHDPWSRSANGGHGKPSDAELRNASKQLLEGEYEEAGKGLRELTTDPLASDKDPVAIIKNIKKLPFGSQVLSRFND